MFEEEHPVAHLIAATIGTIVGKRLLVVGGAVIAVITARMIGVNI